MDTQESITIQKAVINKAISYIFEHLDEEVTVGDVADYCCYSKYHLTRMFKEDMDEALYQFIKRKRLERSAWRLKTEKGNYHNLPMEWCQFLKKYRMFAMEDTRYIECTIDDPSITDEDHCMYELCQTVSLQHPLLKKYSDIMTRYFEGGKYAVYHFKGYPQFMFMVYQNVFCRWLSKTGNRLDDRPILDIYRKVEVNGFMEIDICFPLKI